MEDSLSIVLSEVILNQIEEEYRYFLEEYSLEIAEKFRIDFFDKISNILPLYKRFPVFRFKKSKKYRKIIFRDYLIIFKKQNQSINVLALFHTKQHPRKLSHII